MYSYKISRQAKSTSEILVDIKKTLVENEYKSAFSKLAQALELPGFRKGKAPEKLVEKHIQKEKVYEEVVRSLIPKIYSEIVKKEDLKPIMQPKIELLKAKERNDWEVKIIVAEKPKVDLGNYKEAIKKVKSEQKNDQIWVPGQKDKKQEPSEKEKAKKQQELLNLILSSILKEAKVEISDLIIEEELNQRLSNLLTDIQKIGLTVAKYLQSKNLTQEQLRQRYRNEIEQTYQLEFILAELADKENIKVENSDLEKLFTSITDPKEKESAKANSYFYASVLRKQKTLDYLLNL